MEKIEIKIDKKLKDYLEKQGKDVEKMAQALLDDYLNTFVNQNFETKFTKEEKIDKITNK